MQENKCGGYILDGRNLWLKVTVVQESTCFFYSLPTEDVCKQAVIGMYGNKMTENEYVSCFPKSSQSNLLYEI